MKKQNKIADYNYVLNTYSNKIPAKQLKLLRERKWLPLFQDSKLSREFAYLIGKVMGDGHLDNNFVTYFIGQEKEMKNLKDIILKKFNLEEKRIYIKYKKSKGISYLLSVKDCVFGRLLFILGTPKGNKTKQEFLIPEWISSSKENSKMFLKGILEDELTTIKIEKNNYSVKPRLKLTKHKKYFSNLKYYLFQIKEMIESFDIKCSHISKPIKSKNTDSCELYFHINRNKQNIIKFSENIGFRAHSDKKNI